MSEGLRGDIGSLRNELKNLRDDVAKLGELIQDIARNRAAEASDRLRASAERGWSGAKHTAQTVVGEMEQHPLGSSMTALIVGAILGCMVACLVCMPSRRG